MELMISDDEDVGMGFGDEDGRAVVRGWGDSDRALRTNARQQTMQNLC